MRLLSCLLISATCLTSYFAVNAAADDNKRETEDARGRFGGTESEGERTRVDEILEQWPKSHREVAKTLIERYGRADEATESHLVWIDNGPWAMTLLLREEFEHNWPDSHVDFLQQFVRFKVPVDKFDDIARFDGSVQIDRTAGLVSARCGGEAMNYLALNLAYEIATGKRTTEDARAFYAKTAKGDRSSPYVTSLLFSQSENSADKDVPQQ